MKVVDECWEQIAVSDDTPTEEATSTQKKKTKSKKEEAKAAPKALQERVEAIFSGGNAVDLALFGRMLADMPEKNQHATCQVAHAISTHAVEREFDFYTAVDDLKPEDTAGADMMGTVEFNSACFYRYAAVDWEKLKENLPGDVDLPARGLRAFLEGFVVAEPTGKQNSFAAHNAAELVLVTVRRDTAPRNLANAFESALRVRDGLTKISAERLLAKAKALQDAYGGGSEAWALSLVDADLAGQAQPTKNLSELLDAVMAYLQGS